MTGSLQPECREVHVHRIFRGRDPIREPDVVAVEEPLEIQIGYTAGTRHLRTVSLTMRTPGRDDELAAGFLFTEGILQHPSQISTILRGRNSVRVELAQDVTVDLPRLERNFFTSSACGVCGKTSIEAVHRRVCALPEEGPVVSAAVIHSLPEVLLRSQAVFHSTGGLHASALFDDAGNLIDLQEDVGRHNALDKLIGAQFLKAALPLSRRLLLVSGRASFELVQKAVAAGVPIMAAVGAPSSLAVDLAAESGLTLAAFVRDGRFNVYSGAPRIKEAQ
ncbi:MAG: formate dehydrogenase accessory sulfurtransferase FdhD [Bryobacteraceae bacterium]|nr:formate dehydrogenase accessory sulfurtransferase FdhD [Bryobacteraceae bacterium]